MMETPVNCTDYPEKTPVPDGAHKIAARAGAGLLALALASLMAVVFVVLRPRLQTPETVTPSVHAAIVDVGELNMPHGEIAINSADAEILETLPGIGPKLAAAIVAERENGVFLLPEDLSRVSGIGRKKIEAIRELINMD